MQYALSTLGCVKEHPLRIICFSILLHDARHLVLVHCIILFYFPVPQSSPSLMNPRGLHGVPVPRGSLPQPPPLLIRGRCDAECMAAPAPPSA